MSTELIEGTAGVAVTRYAGPPRPDAAPRRRYQITNEWNGEYVTFDAEQMAVLVAALRNLPAL